MDHDGVEVPLSGGNVSDALVRVGSTVRKPWGPHARSVQAVLEHLNDVGFDGAPRVFDRDDAGRQVLEYITGTMAFDTSFGTKGELIRVGRLIRELHDALAGFHPSPDAVWDVAVEPDRAELVCHNDLAPWNLVLSERRWVFIDWDGVGPASRLWDLGYAAKGFVPLMAGGDPASDGQRLRALVDGYELDEAERKRLPALIGSHTQGMYALLVDAAGTGKQPWARLHAEGHGDHWGPAAEYIERNLATWRRWLLD